jgi:hypothetical protein
MTAGVPAGIRTLSLLSTSLGRYRYTSLTSCMAGLVVYSGQRNESTGHRLIATHLVNLQTAPMV